MAEYESFARGLEQAEGIRFKIEQPGESISLMAGDRPDVALRMVQDMENRGLIAQGQTEKLQASLVSEGHITQERATSALKPSGRVIVDGHRYRLDVRPSRAHSDMQVVELVPIDRVTGGELADDTRKYRDAIEQYQASVGTTRSGAVVNDGYHDPRTHEWVADQDHTSSEHVDDVRARGGNMFLVSADVPVDKVLSAAPLSMAPPAPNGEGVKLPHIESGAKPPPQMLGGVTLATMEAGGVQMTPNSGAPGLHAAVSQVLADNHLPAGTYKAHTGIAPSNAVSAGEGAPHTPRVTSSVEAAAPEAGAAASLSRGGSLRAAPGRLSSHAGIALTGIEVAADVTGATAAIRMGDYKTAAEHAEHTAKVVGTGAAVHMLSKTSTWETAATVLEDVAKGAKMTRVVGEKLPVIGAVVAMGAALMETGTVAYEASKGKASWAKVGSTAVANVAEIGGAAIGFGADVALREAVVYGSRKVLGEKDAASHSATVQVAEFAYEGAKRLVQSQPKSSVTDKLPDHSLKQVEQIGVSMQQAMNSAGTLSAAAPSPKARPASVSI